MRRFKHFIKEGKYPLWVRFTVGGLVLRIKNLSTQIESEKDVVKQNKLIAQQNNILSYISGLSVAVGSTDYNLLKRLKNGMGGGKK